MRRMAFSRALGCLVAAGVVIAGPAGADTTIRVDDNGDGGWMFNADPVNATAMEFSLDESSIGGGSLKAGPISATVAAEKFIAGLGLGVAVADFTSVSYDFLISGSGTAEDADEFYVNVYANIDDSTNYYDCRFDFVAATGSTSAFTTASFASTTTPTTVVRRSTARIATCPATLAQMPAGSHVRAIALNVGDTSLDDGGLVGYLDNVVVTETSGATTYDFEVPVPVKDACKDGGWADYGFAGQGDCISSLQANANAGR